MTDLSQLSDADLQALYAQQSQPRGIRNNNPLNLKTTGTAGQDGPFAVYKSMDEGLAAADQNLLAYHSKHGINTVAGVVNRWAPPNADGNHTANYIKAVAGGMGVDPNAQIDLTDPNTRQALLGHMAAYENGKPVAAASADDLTHMSDADLLALYGKATAPKALPAPGKPIVAQVQRPAPQASPTIAQDVVSGLASPFKALGHDIMDEYRRKAANVAPPSSLMDAGKRTLADITGSARMLGDTLGLASAPVQAVVRPVARAVNRVALPTQAPQLSFQGGQPTLSAPRQLQGDEAQATTEGAINSALSAIRPASPVPVAAIKPTPRTLADLNQEQNTAWKAVDASGYRFPKADVQGAASDIRKIVDDAGPELYENSAKIANRVEDLASRGDLTPAQANRLRSQVGEKLLTPGSTEASVGRAIKDRIDQLIDTHAQSNSLLGDARQKYTQYLKMKDVSDRLEDAGINQAASGNGGNLNAARQALKPLVKNKSAQRMRNATPDEMAALKNVVGGTPGQNLLRAASAFDPFHSKLGTLLQTGLGFKTGGLSALTIPLGVAATAGEKAIAGKNIQDLLDLISTGGRAAKASPVYPTLALGGRPPVPMLSPAGLAGVGVATAPLARIPSAKAKKRDPSRAR